MSKFTTTHRPGRCFNCEGEILTTVFRRDEAYCCLGCAGGGPCICLYEQDLADDGVDHLGLPFAMPVSEPALEAREDASVTS